MHKLMWMTASLAALLLTGCSSDSPEPKQPTTTDQPKQAQPDKGQSAGPKENGTTPAPITGEAGQGNEGNPASEKTDDQIKGEIRTKLARLTAAKTGYSLPADANLAIKGAATLEDVTEMLRKKGYSVELAKTLTHEFFKEKDGHVVMVARDGYAGRFLEQEDAEFTKSGKHVWTVVQKHLDDQLHGPHVSTYEVEVLKDGTYRLNSWKNKQL
jgi:hypothetical protein